jgi:hypothetical protein
MADDTERKKRRSERLEGPASHDCGKVINDRIEVPNDAG